MSEKQEAPSLVLVVSSPIIISPLSEKWQGLFVLRYSMSGGKLLDPLRRL